MSSFHTTHTTHWWFREQPSLPKLASARGRQSQGAGGDSGRALDKAGLPAIERYCDGTAKLKL